MKKGFSDSYLQQLWRKAVYAQYNHRCAVCGDLTIEAHHIVKRRKAVLKHDWRNGIALCHKHHEWIETLAGKEWLSGFLSEEQKQYLFAHEVNLKDYLFEKGLTREEFSKRQAQEL